MGFFKKRKGSRGPLLFSLIFFCAFTSLTQANPHKIYDSDQISLDDKESSNLAESSRVERSYYSHHSHNNSHHGHHNLHDDYEKKIKKHSKHMHKDKNEKSYRLNKRKVIFDDERYHRGDLLTLPHHKNHEGNKNVLRDSPHHQNRRKYMAFTGTESRFDEGRRRISDTDDEDLLLGSGYSSESFEGSGAYDYEYEPSEFNSSEPEVDSKGPGSKHCTESSCNGLEKRFYRVSMIIGGSWSPALKESSSSTFRVMQEKLEREFESTDLDVEALRVIKFENIEDPAFVRCIFDLGIVGATFQDVEEELNVCLQTGRIGQLIVRKEGFSVRDIGAVPEVCGSDQIMCLTGVCLNISKRCDLVYDCGDDDPTDEQGCPNPETGGVITETPTTSTTASLITEAPVTVVDDTSDPLPSPKQGCRADDQVRCSDGSTYICSDQVCDGTPDCPGGDDEIPEKCAADSGCLPGQMQCDITKCISQEKICDYHNDCLDGSDEDSCPPPVYRCLPFEWQCDSGDCILQLLVCNGDIDCLIDGGSDEKYCDNDNSDKFSCDRTTHYQCDDGTCIEKILVCDGIRHCDSDENDGLCKPITPRPSCNNVTEFTCYDGTCISIYERCNGFRDCPRDSADEDGCPPPRCRADEFRCDDGSCLPSYLVCDGTRSCRNGEDENDCGSTCSPDQFQCRGGQCIHAAYKCDDYPDCADRSDEDEALCGSIGKPCRDDEFACHAGGCVPIDRVCSNSIDCPDGSDELNCPPPITTTPRPGCHPSEFRCSSGDQCIPQSAVCNSMYDCNDFSDERNCNVGPQPVGLDLKTYPSEQNIKQGNEVVFQCRDEGPFRAPVKWSRSNGLPLPPGSSDNNGRLEMPNIQTDHTGTYVCEAVGYPPSAPGSRVSVFLRVDPYEAPPTRPPTACGYDEATCSTGDCIPKRMICDGDIDCPDGSDEMRCRGSDGCEPNEFQCGNKRCVPKTWLCDSDDDCGDGSDERSCAPPPPGSPCRYDEYMCSDKKQCIPKAFVCDKNRDCITGSDELGCTAPVIQRPPPPLMTIDRGQMFNVSCTAVGMPTPEVIWRLNWGHVPDKCDSRSYDGVGVLTCPNMQTFEQGAYSCEAINSLGSTFAIPDCILVVKPPAGICTTGYFNDFALSVDECLPCFGFGHAAQCSSSSLYRGVIPPVSNGFRVIGVSQDFVQGTVEILDRGYPLQFQSLRPIPPSGVELQVPNTLASSIQSNVIPFFALPQSYNGNLLPSYGGDINYTVHYRGSGKVLNAPDIIISGNGKIIMHLSDDYLLPNRDNYISARIWPGEWFKGMSSRPGEDQKVFGVQPASREEIMEVLANVDHLLLRAQYDSGPSLDTTVTDIRMDKASTVNTGLGKAVLVEECRCPIGYVGLSCESCAPGYERRRTGPWLGSCVKPRQIDCPVGSYVDYQQCLPCPCPSRDQNFGSSCFKDTDNQVTCNCNPGHTGRNCDQCEPGYERDVNYPYGCRPSRAECDIKGSVSPTPDPFTGRCQCKELTYGPRCDQCKEKSFFLSSSNQHGCVNCFCMGVTESCASSNWYRDQEVAVFVNSPNEFTLMDETQRNWISEGFTIEPNSRELGFTGFSRYAPEIYYWQLPYRFLGNKVTSYGGFLNYTVRYVPPPGGQNSRNSAADVELNGNDIRLLYFHKESVPSGRDFTVSVPFLEQHWQRQDGQTAKREHLMMALANLDALMIKATYTTSTREAYISDVTMDYAVSRNTDQSRAFAVEQCSCPAGYQGLSCQECAYGYTRSLRGLYLGLCEPCSCNGHSEECDPRTGVCRNCRDYTTGDFCEHCEEGYTLDPRSSRCVRREYRCSCDPRGSSQLDCPDGRNCICKGNVDGPSCDQCKPGTFSLQEFNPQGCLDCYCSRVSSECSSARLYRIKIDMQGYSRPHDFTLTDSTRTSSYDDIDLDQSLEELSHRYSARDHSSRMFWSLPAKFTGNRLTSYGGYLKATRRFYVRPGTPPTSDEDIDFVIVGRNGVSIYWISGPQQAGQEFATEVPLRETAGWRHLDGAGNMANREDLLGVLADIEAILIRASFTENMEITYLKQVSLDDAVRQYTPNGQVVEVEECRCPPGYEGLSCQRCSPGFYKDINDQSEGIGGACRACPCDENAEGCEVQDGRPICICRPGYTGPRCESRADETLPVPTVPQPEGPKIEVSISEPVVQVVQIGTLVPFRCRGRSLENAAVRISWSRERGAIPVGKARDDGQGLLLITDVRPEDSGVYICTVTDGYSSASDRAILNVTTGVGPPPPVPGTRPEVTIVPRYADVRVDEPVEIRCTASGYPTPTVTWSKADGTVPSGIQMNGQVLKIARARKSHEGEYQCRARNNVGVASERAVVYVREDVSRPAPIPPEFGLVATINPSSYEARPGETVVYRCEGSVRDSRVDWSRSSGLLPPSALQTPDGTLTLYSVREIDAGIYTCTISLPSGKSTQAQTRLTVSYISTPPSARIEPERQTVDQGTDILIRCVVTGNPSPSIEWTKVGATLPSYVEKGQAELRIPKAEVSDRGVYVCTVESSAGKSLASAVVEVERREQPQIELYPESTQTVVKGGSALFQCRVIAGIPSPTVKWSRADGRRIPSNVEEIQGGVLRFNQVSGDEAGQYICNVRNIVGSTTALANLKIQVPPKATITPSVSPHRVSFGSRVTLECEAEGDPLPSVVWQQLQPGRLDNIERASINGTFTLALFSPQSAVYEIQRVTRADQGSYSCIARNSAGFDEKRIQILVDDPNDNIYETNEISPTNDRSDEQLYYFPAGSRAELNCMQPYEHSYYEQLFMDWSRDDGGAMPSGYETQDGVLYINDVKTEDAGRYSCVGRNRQGQVIFNVHSRLEVIGAAPPKIDLLPARQVVRRGDIVHIHCMASGDEPITINWFKTDRRPFPDSVIVSGPRLTFREIEVTDAGRYACQATNLGGTSESVAEVIVNSGPLEARPTGKEQVANEGSTAVLECDVRGEPVVWTKDGGPLPGVAFSFGTKATILGLAREHSGRYTCETSEGSDYIDLIVKPIAPSRLRRRCRSNEFLCRSNNHCISKTLVCNDILDCIDGTDELNCLDENSINGLVGWRRRSKRGASPVDVQIIPSKESLEVGDNLELTCDVTGDPDAIIRWTKVGGDFEGNVLQIGSLLKISNLTPENGGVYRCIVNADTGVHEEDYALAIHLNLAMMQSLSPTETRAAPFGTTVTMDCQTGLRGRIEYTWSKQGGVIPSYTDVNGPTLTISYVTAEDAGNYICSVSNMMTTNDVTTVLTVTGVVPYFRQAPVSFMTFPTLPDAYLKFDIQISFKPEDINGLILYNGQRKDGTGDFVSFGLSGGYPEFRFDVGSGSAVIRGEKPLSLGNWHTVSVHRERTEGSMFVNGEGPFIGKIYGSFQGLDLLHEPMFIGGVPDFSKIHILAGHTKGFVGCISELIIGGVRQQIFRDSQTSRGVSNCDTCLVNSCINNGVCQEGLGRRGYSCICPPGYSGEDCELAGGSCSPGICGAGRCVNVRGGFECYCPFGIVGPRCEREVIIHKPSFHKKSYLTYPKPKALKKLNLKMRFKLRSSENGLLMYCSQTEDGLGDYTSLAVKDRHLEFQYDTGSGPAVLRSREEIEENRWIDVTVSRELQDGELIVNGEVTKGKSPGSTRGLNLRPPLFIGGFDPHRIQLNPNVGVQMGFQGCIEDIAVKGLDIDLINSVIEGANVNNCDSTNSECSAIRCLNGGHCMPNSTIEMCICPLGYGGKFCEIIDSCSSKPCKNGGTCFKLSGSNYQCSCVKGFHGRHCEHALNFTESVAFRRDGYLELSTELLPHGQESEEVIELEITTSTGYGLLFWHGQDPTALDPVDFLSIGFQQGKLEFRWNLGNGAGSAISSRNVTDGQRHKIVVKRQRNFGSIEVDSGGIADFGESPAGGDMMLTANGNIYIGGVPNPRMTQGLYNDGFIGCVHSLRIQNSDPIDLNENSISAVNAGPCVKDSYQEARTSPDSYVSNSLKHQHNGHHPKFNYHHKNSVLNPIEDNYIEGRLRLRRKRRYKTK